MSSSIGLLSSSVNVLCIYPFKVFILPVTVCVLPFIQVAAFNMGSTVVLVFQAPISLSQENGDSSSEFRFSVQRGDRVRVGEALGRWQDR